MGAEYPASWSLDSEGSGFEKMESGINARVVDYTRFGSIFLHNVFWNDAQILPEEWVYESTAPLDPDPREWVPTAQAFLDNGGYYKYHWRGFLLADGGYDFAAAGHFRQFIYAALRKNVVIVRLGGETDYPVVWQLIFRSLLDEME